MSLSTLRFWQTLLGMASAAMLGGLVFLFVPADIVANNPRDFSAADGFARHLPWFLASFAALFLGLSIAVAIAPSKIKTMLVGLLAFMAFGSYAQGMLVNWSYGPLTGEPIDWTNFPIRGYVDVIVWLAVGLLSALAVARPKGATAILAALFASQTALTAFRMPERQLEDLSEAEDAFHEAARISPERNIVLVILDAVQSDIAAEILTSREDLKAAFDGFTYYRDAASNFPATEFSIGAMLSGIAWKQGEPQTKYFAGTYADHSVLGKALEAGYMTSFYSSKAQYCEAVLRADDCNLYGLQMIRSQSNLTRYQLLDVSLFRAAPQQIKAILFHEGKWWLSDSIAEIAASRHRVEVDFVKELSSSLVASAPVPTFKVFHFLFTHGPIRLSADCTWGIHVTSREAYAGQGSCGLLLVAELLQDLERIGVYDQSMVIVTSDHGNGFPIKASEFSGIAQPDWRALSPEVAPNVPGTAYPLLMVKPAGHRGALKISDAAVQLSDLAGVICQEIEGCDAQSYGTFGDPKRLRTYRYYDFREVEKSSDYFAPMSLFEIRGEVFDPSAWHYVGPQSISSDA